MSHLNSVSLEESLLGTMSPLEQCLLGTMSPWNKVSLEQSLLGTKSPWNSVPWNKVPWNTVPLEQCPLEQCGNTLLCFFQLKGMIDKYQWGLPSAPNQGNSLYCFAMLCFNRYVTCSVSILTLCIGLFKC